MKPVAFEHTDSRGQRQVSYINRVGDTKLYAIDFTKYKLVPLEPTENMLFQSHKAVSGLIAGDKFPTALDTVRASHKAMIEAAPDIEDL